MLRQSVERHLCDRSETCQLASACTARSAQPPVIDSNIIVHDLTVPNFKFKTVDDVTFCSVEPRLWNSLPHSLRTGALACSDAPLALLLLFYVSISWPLTLVASCLIRLCSCLLLFCANGFPKACQ